MLGYLSYWILVQWNAAALGVMNYWLLVLEVQYDYTLLLHFKLNCQCQRKSSLSSEFEYLMRCYIGLLCQLVSCYSPGQNFVCNKTCKSNKIKLLWFTRKSYLPKSLSLLAKKLCSSFLPVIENKIENTTMF